MLKWRTVHIRSNVIIMFNNVKRLIMLENICEDNILSILYKLKIIIITMCFNQLYNGTYSEAMKIFTESC